MMVSKDVGDSNLIVPLEVYRTSRMLIEEAVNDVHFLGTEATLETVLELLQHCLFLGMGKVMVADMAKHELRLMSGYDLPEDKKQITYAFDEGLIGRAFSSGRVLTVFDLIQQTEYKGKFNRVDELPYIRPGFTAMPIKGVNGEVLGVLAVNHGGRSDIERAELVAVLHKTAKLLAPLLH